MRLPPKKSGWERRSSRTLCGIAQLFNHRTRKFRVITCSTPNMDDLSISKRPRGRATDEEVAWVLEQFGAVGFEERPSTNNVRHFEGPSTFPPLQP